jgi:hypothetical protein
MNPKSGQRWGEIELKDRLMIEVTVGVLLVAGFTGWIFVRQANLMQDQLDEMRGGGQQTERLLSLTTGQLATSARLATQAAVQAMATNSLAKQARREVSTAEKALVLARQSLGLEQRPWVVTANMQLSSEPDVGKKISIKVTLANTGRTPATSLVNQSQMLMGTQEPAMTRFIFPARVISRGIMAPTNPGISSVLSFTTDEIELKEPQLTAYKMKQMKLYIHALIRYRDFTSNRYWTRICSYRTFGDPLDSFNYCEDGNEVGEGDVK